MQSDLSTSSVLRLEQMSGIPNWVVSWTKSDSFSKGPVLQLFYSKDSSLPAFFEDAAQAVLFDGSVLNRANLLKIYGQNISIDPNDAELILQLYRRRGEDFVKEIKGVFLLILWDGKQNLLLCFRDRCGAHPFFYSDSGAALLFARSAEDLIRYPNVGKTINRAVIVEHLSQRRSIPEDTFYSAVKRIMPGHGLRIQNNHRKTLRYWYPFPETGDTDWITSEERLSEFDSVFEQAISRIMNLGAPAIFLSGGLDSVSVACIATDLAARSGYSQPSAYSIGFPHPDCNEEPVQKSVAKQLGIAQSFTPVNEILGSKGLLWSSIELGREWSQPMVNAWKPLYMFLGAEAKRFGCNVIMTGSGGDDWLTVNSQYAADLIRHLQFKKLFHFTQNMRRSYRLPKWAQLRHILWNSGLRPLLGLQGRKLMRRFAPGSYHNHMSRKFRNRPFWLPADPNLRKEVDERNDVLLKEFLQKPDLNGRYAFYSQPFPNYFVSSIASLDMEEDFESSQKIGLPVFPPYYDSDLVELLLRIHPDLLHRGGMEKGVVRDAVARRFPDLKFKRQKKVTARGYWQSVVTGEGPAVWERMNGIDSLIEYGIVDSDSIAFLKHEGFSSSNVAMNHRIWHLMSMEAWLRAHIR